MDIILESQILQVKKINKKTKTYMFKDLKVGDLVKFTVTLERAGKAQDGSTHATYVSCVNLQNDDIVDNSFNQIAKFLDIFDFEEYKETPFEHADDDNDDW